MNESMMRAVVAEAPGGADALEVRRVPLPRFGDDQILIRVRACGVCGHDALSRAGAIPMSYPRILGHEIAGEVAEVGSRVGSVRPGQRVATAVIAPCGRCDVCRQEDARLCRAGGGLYGHDSDGGYAEYVVASEWNVVPLPAAISYAEGAILTCAIGSGLRALQRGRVTAGETVLVTGASGGVGIHTLQLARAAGARVIATTTSASKEAELHKAGADDVVVVPDGTFHEVVKGLTGGRGCDLAIENVGTPTLSSTLRSLRARGRAVLVGNLQPGPVDVSTGLMIMQEIELIGTARPHIPELRQVIDMVQAGRVHPLIDTTYPLREASAAHRRLENRDVVGRVVLIADAKEEGA